MYNLVKRLFLKKVAIPPTRKDVGFTLLDLIIVIGIIGILVAASAVSYTTVQKKARDSTRKQDVTNISKAFEQYYSVCGLIYPTVRPEGLGGSTIHCPSPSIMIMENVPFDTSTNFSYNYYHPGGQNTFRLCAEDPNGSADSYN